MTPQSIIADFLISAFTDERLAILRADAAVGKVPYLNCSECLVGHSKPGGWTEGGTKEETAASVAYLALGEGLFGDLLRQARLVPLIDAEISRRAALRNEVLEAVRPALIASLEETLCPAI